MKSEREKKKINKLFFYGKLKFLFHHHKLVHKKTISPLPLLVCCFPIQPQKKKGLITIKTSGFSYFSSFLIKKAFSEGILRSSDRTQNETFMVVM